MAFCTIYFRSRRRQWTPQKTAEAYELLLLVSTIEKIRKFVSPMSDFVTIWRLINVTCIFVVSTRLGLFGYAVTLLNQVGARRVSELRNCERERSTHARVRVSLQGVLGSWPPRACVAKPLEHASCTCPLTLRIDFSSFEFPGFSLLGQFNKAGVAFFYSCNFLSNFTSSLEYTVDVLNFFEIFRKRRW